MGPVAAAVAVVTWLASVAMVPRVVMGVAREEVTVPRLDTPAETDRGMMMAHDGGGTPEGPLIGAYLWFP